MHRSTLEMLFQSINLKNRPDTGDSGSKERIRQTVGRDGVPEYKERNRGSVSGNAADVV